MARSKHPEETVVKILDVAMRLFVERGYEQTSMQNIIDGLGGLTKGAVYHHFSSKEEIFLAAMDRVMAPGAERLRKIRDAEGMTGREKIRAMFDNGARGVDSAFFSQADPELDPMRNPRMLATEYRDLFAVSAHELMMPVIEQGVEDGTIQTEYPRIIDELGGLTKGAVYHHFSSKEEIFLAAMDRVTAPGVERLRGIRDAEGMTGREKIQTMFENGARGVDSAFFSQADPELDPMKNPRMLAAEYRDLFDVSAHELMLPAIEQGVEDGSIQTDYPRELAETIALLNNLWCVPAFFPARDEEEQRRRVAFMNDFLSAMGLEIALDPRVSLETWRRRCGETAQEDDGADACADARARR